MVSKKVERVVEKFLERPDRMRRGAGCLAKRYNVSRVDIYEARDEARRKMRAKQEKVVKRLFFDIETSPNVAYVWETGYKIRVPWNQIIEERQIICISYKWWGEEKVHNIYWKDRSDRNVIEEFLEVAQKADEVVTFNGDKFDIPFLLGRAAYWNLKAPSKYRSFDLYKKVKAQFKMNSYSLNYCCNFFGVAGKIETGGFDLWKDILQTHDKKISKEAGLKMVAYCNQDIVATEDLYNRINKYTKPVTNMSVLHGGEKWGCPKCGCQKVGYEKSSTSAMGVVKRHMSCNACGTYYDISNKTFMRMIDFNTNENANTK